MRALLFAAALLGVGAHTATAQDFAPMASPPIAPTDMINYCVYGGLVYSVGSQICVVRGGLALYCEQRPPDPGTPGATPGARGRASWTSNQPPATLNCANDPFGAGPRPR